MSSLASSAIESLRAAIPAPTSATSVPIYGEDFVLPPLDDEETSSADAAPEAAGLPVLADAAPVVAPEAVPADAAPAEAAPALTDAPVAPAKRRGRPRRSEVTPAAAETPTAPARRRGRPPCGEAATTKPAVSNAADRRAPSPTVLPVDVSPPALVVSPVAAPSFGVLLRLWRELHPQGRRAVM